jgi:hypothetical protein
MRYREVVALVRKEIKKADKLSEKAVAKFVIYYLEQKLVRAEFMHGESINHKQRSRRALAQKRKIDELMAGLDVSAMAWRHQLLKQEGVAWPR